jgi:tetratricopeptide (TPR) repeat protein
MFHETGFKMEEDLDFEISFYEDLVKEKPDFVDALILLGDAYTKKGLDAKALDADLKLSVLCPKDPAIHYNLACDYSVLKDADRCLEVLEKAISFG